MSWFRLSLALILMVFLAGCSVAIPAGQESQPAIPSQPEGLSPTQPGAGGNAPPSWSGLGLKGSLILLLRNEAGSALVRLSLETGAITQLYQADQGALLSSALVSPDGKQILLTYAPPATAQNQLTYTSLYLMPSDGSSPPRPVFPIASPVDAYFAPTWSPDGQAVYSSHYHKGNDPNGADAFFSIDRVTLDGQGQEVIKAAMWPRLSPDGSQIAFVSSTPESSQNDLFLAGEDGKDIRPPLPPGSFPAIDDHFFTPDGSAIIFSAVTLQPSPTPTLLDRLFGIQIASAHTIPSDWYRVPVKGGTVERLTHLEDTGMYASLSPDRTRIAFISATGIYVMNLDGSNLTLLNQLVATGTVDWVK